MKRLLHLFVALCAAFTAQAQVTEVWKDGVMQANVDNADSIRFSKTIMSRQDIEAWAKAHVDSLAGVVWKFMQASTTPNTLDPDLTREVFRSIGYDGRNVFTFFLGGNVVDNALLDSLIVRARAAGNNKVVLIAGHSGSGKSTAIRSAATVAEEVSNAGIVLDQIWSNRTDLVNMLNLLRGEGFTDQTVVLVYNDAETSFKNACDRFLRTRRVIGFRFFVSDYLFKSYQGYVPDFLEKEVKDMGVKRIYLNNAKNTTSVVTAEEAAKWDYTLSLEQEQKMVYDLYNYIYEHKDVISSRDAWAMFYDE